MRQHLLNTPTYNVLRSIDIFRETLACGITTARDMGGADAGFRAAIEEGLIDGPRLLISLGMISQTGGHGDYWVPADMRIKKRAWLPDTVADGVEEIRRVVRELLMRGADFIKICATGGITSVTDSWDEPQFTIEEIRTAVEEAAAKRRRVAVHAEGIDGIRNAVQAGIHSLEHGWFIDEQAVDKMIEMKTWWVPTLALVPLSVKKRGNDKSWAGHQMGQEDVKDKADLRPDAGADSDLEGSGAPRRQGRDGHRPVASPAGRRKHGRTGIHGELARHDADGGHRRLHQQGRRMHRASRAWRARRGQGRRYSRGRRQSA